MPAMSVTAIPTMKITKLLICQGTKKVTETEDAGHPNSHENRLLPVEIAVADKPKRHAEDETDECRQDEKILTLHFLPRDVLNKIDVCPPTDRCLCAQRLQSARRQRYHIQGDLIEPAFLTLQESRVSEEAKGWSRRGRRRLGRRRGMVVVNHQGHPGVAAQVLEALPGDVVIRKQHVDG